MSMSQRLVRLLWPLCVLPVLGCSNSKPVSFVALQPPVLACEPSPDVPMVDDPAVFARYCVDVWAAGQSCRSAVTDYRRWAESLPR